MVGMRSIHFNFFFPILVLVKCQKSSLLEFLVDEFLTCAGKLFVCYSATVAKTAVAEIWLQLIVIFIIIKKLLFLN